MLLIVGYFGFTAFGIAVFASLFEWLTVFMRFLDAASLPE